MRIVITGPPGSGKTTLLRSPELNVHYDLFDECARSLQIVFPGLKGERLHEAIEKLQLQDYKAAEKKVRHCIYDRGIPDQLAYRRYFSDDVPDDLYHDCEEKRYDIVFYLPFWDEIYEQDTVRKETRDEAKEIGVCIKLSYQILGYEPIVVPKGTIQQRVNFILSKINEHTR